MSRKATQRWKSRFARFVGTYGVERLASKLQVHPTAVYQWIRGSTRPKPEHAAIIQSLARERGTRLKFEEIYGHSRDLRALDHTVTVAIERRKTASATALQSSERCGNRSVPAAQSEARRSPRYVGLSGGTSPRLLSPRIQELDDLGRVWIVRAK